MIWWPRSKPHSPRTVPIIFWNTNNGRNKHGDDKEKCFHKPNNECLYHSVGASNLAYFHINTRITSQLLSMPKPGKGCPQTLELNSEIQWWALFMEKRPVHFETSLQSIFLYCVRNFSEPSDKFEILTEHRSEILILLLSVCRSSRGKIKYFCISFNSMHRNSTVRSVKWQADYSFLHGCYEFPERYSLFTAY